MSEGPAGVDADSGRVAAAGAGRDGGKPHLERFSNGGERGEDALEHCGGPGVFEVAKCKDNDNTEGVVATAKERQDELRMPGWRDGGQHSISEDDPGRMEDVGVQPVQARLPAVQRQPCRPRAGIRGNRNDPRCSLG